MQNREANVENIKCTVIIEVGDILENVEVGQLNSDLRWSGENEDPAES